MQITVQRHSLLSVCQSIGAVVPTKSVNEIFQSILLEAAANDECQVTAADSELEVKTRCKGVQVQKPGKCLLPFEKMLSILKASKDDDITLGVEGDSIVIRGEHAEYELPSTDPLRFPSDAWGDLTFQTPIKVAVFHDLLRFTAFAVSADGKSSRYAATSGLLLSAMPDRIVSVLTDTRRLAVFEHALVLPDTTAVGPVIPVKAVKTLDNLFAGDDEITIGCSKTHFSAQSAQTTLCTRLLEGRYPDWTRVVPKERGQKMVVPVASLLPAVSQAAIMADKESHAVAFSLSSNRLQLKAQSSRNGKAKVEIKVDYSGPEIEVLFSPGFLTDFLKLLPKDEILGFYVRDSKNPAVIVPETISMQYVVVPVVKNV